MDMIKITESLYLDLLNESHAENLFQLVQKNRDHLGKWLGWVAKTKSVSDSLKFIQESCKKFEKKSVFTFGIFWNGQQVGMIDAHAIDLLNRKAVLGYWLAADFCGEGLLSQAILVFLQWLKETHLLHRIEIHMAVGNNKSENVAKRLDFVREGTMKDAEYLNGIFHDQYLYAKIIE